MADKAAEEGAKTEAEKQVEEEAETEAEMVAEADALSQRVVTTALAVDSSLLASLRLWRTRIRS
jgi:hypothetical protein